ncbi:MAG: zinc ribbon domain-containing protein, partial [Clostridia bacterium]|nr:zinc ribbon domain-containing protein [Clostridia bacterium]
MFCIKCGVELADTEKVCPLCGTAVFHPELTQKDVAPNYPPYRKPHSRVNRRGVLFLITAFYLMLAIQLAVCEISIFHRLNWSLYAIGGLAVSYIVMILPIWFSRPNPVVFVSCDFAAAALYLLFINEFTGGDWFLTFALPVVFWAAIIVTAVISLSRYIGRGYFLIFGGASVLTGAFIVMIEILLHLTFAPPKFYFWSVYPLIAFGVLGVALIIIGLCRPLRES